MTTTAERREEIANAPTHLDERDRRAYVVRDAEAQAAASSRWSCCFDRGAAFPVEPCDHPPGVPLRGRCR